jgi:hypothetical protein
MILLNSSAFHIFWLGRYISRIQYVCNLFPFQQDDVANDYAQAFCLPAFDAASLNQLVLDEEQSASFKQQFNFTKDNIHELRGVLTAYGYAELNKLIKTASENPGYICDVVTECFDILEAESHDVFLFFKLGQSVEQLDRELRLKHDISITLQELSIVVTLLEELGWENLIENWETMSKQKDWASFYQFTAAISEMFGVDA